jgi:TonB family protein
MPPSAKEFDVITSASEKAGASPAASGARPEDTAGRAQPVALEVPVTVNGARTVEGSDKREPFSESSQTVLVFGTGAVIRLASTVTPGQLLFLTNDKTKKEVVCQVVKSKNYPGVSGYVELEFTEVIAGFWGMRFPGERGPAQPAAPAAKIPSPTASGAPRPVESRPAPAPTAAIKPAEPSVAHAKLDTASTLKKEAPVAPAAASREVPQAKTPAPASSAPKTETNVASALNLPRASGTPAITGLPKIPAPPVALGTGVTNLARTPESKPAAPVVTQAKPATPASQTSSDALKLESARLQEQLSSMLFAVPSTPKPASPASAPPVVNKQASVDSAAKVLAISKAEHSRPAVGPPAKNTPVKNVSALDAEEVKIPSWLEPLARNASTPAHNEILAKDEVAHHDQPLDFKVQDVSAPLTAHETQVAAPAEPTVGIPMLGEDLISAPQRASAGSNKGILIGAIAAALVVLAAGGTWYVRQSSAPAQVPAAAATAPSITPATGVTNVAPPSAQTAAKVPAAAAASANAAPVTPPPAGTSSPVNAHPATPAAEVVKIAPEKNSATELSAYKKLAEPQPKKPSIGPVHLATPTINRSAATRDAGEAAAAPALNEGQVSANADALGGGLVTANTKQPAAPAAPLPIGGDVKPARLLSPVSPVYPMLAKSQHVVGDVRIDALIDTNGHVSAMKVVSGPTLLHQAAMDALRQWKYQPATLDGQPVSMHLTVTLQFRLQ